MTIRHLDFASPVILRFAVEFIKDEFKIGSKYHPDKDMFIIDSKLLARIWFYERNLLAEVAPAHSIYCSKILQWLANEGVVGSPFDKGGFKIERTNNGSCDIKVIKYSRLDISNTGKTEKRKWVSQTQYPLDETI